MTDEDALVRGVQFAEDNLKIVEASFGPRTAMAYAGAMACGARNYIAERHGAVAAWDLLTGLSDDLMTASLDKQMDGRRE